MKENESERRLNPENLRRKDRKDRTAVEEKVEPKVSSPVDKVIDLAFNPSREKLREVTIIDRMQGRLFPLLDMVNAGQQYILEIAIYREDAKAYEKQFGKPVPESPNLLDEFLFRTAQWQKSVQGKNLERATDIALAEVEGRDNEGDPFSGDTWKDD